MCYLLKLTDITVLGCGGIVTNSSGTIASPLHPQAYPHGTTCRWIIKGEPGSVIRLTFQTFSLERSASCKFDYVEVFDNRSVSMGSGRIGRFVNNAILFLVSMILGFYISIKL